MHRNWMEGHFTKWHVDLAYPHLHAKLRVLYPEHPTLPSPDDVLQWRRARDELNAEWRAFHALPKRQQCDGARVALGKRRDDLASLELRWAPPAHLSILRSPIPATSFKRAAGEGRAPYHVLRTADLVPVEQADLVQDVLGADVLLRLSSCDARAYISVCRPVGQFFQTRQLTKTGRVMPTMWHQSGDLPLEPLSAEQDRARGMFSSCVASDAFRKNLFKLRNEERAALPVALAWLQDHNPWMSAYATSLQQMRGDLDKLCASLDSLGRVLPGGLEEARTRKGTRLADELDGEQVALLMPLDPLGAVVGSYPALRACAETIATSTLQPHLPPEWQRLVENPVCDREECP